VVAVLLLLIPIGSASPGRRDRQPWPVLVAIPLGFTLALAPRVAKQWERAVVLRLGRYVGLRGPGLFWIVPFVDSVTKWIDQRVITTSFAAEETLTSDTVPVNVDAVLFWLVYDPEKARSKCRSTSRRSAGRRRRRCATSSAGPR
jgi:regulator of protease activity HflC (stomatin/prohibitin superfamily)